MQYQLVKWNRLIPKEGIRIYPEVFYRDSNDIKEEDRWDTHHKIVYDHIQWRLMAHSKSINKGSEFGRRYSVYVYQGDKLIGMWTLKEVLDNPHGYGKDDFLFVKYVYPEFRHTRFVRYASADLLHMLFKSGKANRLYCYLPCGKPTESKFFLDVADPKLPCIGKRFPTDAIDVQKYILVKEEIPTPWGNYFILEFNGKIYNSMNLPAYMKVHGRSDETIKRWLEEMDDASKRIL